MTKAEIRKEILSRRKAISREDRTAISEAIADHFFSNFDLSYVKFLHVFLPIERFNEVDTKLIIAKVWKEYPDVRTVVPRVNSESNEIENLTFDPYTKLIKNAWEIEEPAHDEFVAAERLDLVLVPGLCFDGQGHRVGYGKGYYDRLLRKCRPDCTKVGLSFFELVDKIEDVHDGDVKMDSVITAEHMVKY
jgi:5-formyltetrahydrofolate cyclo-ligase